jgi:hypothetical protein
MKRLLAAVVSMFAVAGPASATEWMICSAGEEASFSVLLGTLGIGVATDFEVSAGGKHWSTKEGQGTAITRLQAFENDMMIYADVATADLGSVVAALRVFKASEGESIVSGGTLRIPGVGAWVVNCEG